MGHGQLSCLLSDRLKGRLAHHMQSGVVACREESDGKVNTNLVEQKLRSFSTKVGFGGGGVGAQGGRVYSWRLNCASPADLLLPQVHTVATSVAFKPDAAAEEDQKA